MRVCSDSLESTVKLEGDASATADSIALFSSPHIQRREIRVEIIQKNNSIFCEFQIIMLSLHPNSHCNGSNIQRGLSGETL